MNTHPAADLRGSIAILSVLVAAFVVIPPSANAIGDYDTSWSSIDDGGNSITLGQPPRFILHGVIGQPDAGILTYPSSNRTLLGGFVISESTSRVFFLTAGSSIPDSSSSLCIPVQLDEAPTSDTTVQYFVAAGTAIGGGIDYTLLGSAS